MSPSVRLDINTALETLAARFSLSLPVAPKKSNRVFYFLKTSEAYYFTTKDKHLRPSLLRWMSWGMMSNGLCLTQKTSVSPRTESGSLLSDILEENVPPKYFLSPTATERLLYQGDLKQTPLPPAMARHNPQARTLLKVGRRKKN